MIALLAVIAVGLALTVAPVALYLVLWFAWKGIWVHVLSRSLISEG